MRLLYQLLKIFFIILLVISFVAGGIFIVLTFGKTSFDTTSITNAGFAIFAGCSSVCFSWARNLEEKGIENGRINLYGESLFLSAICFVIASLLKYIVIHRSYLISEEILDHITFIFPVINVIGATMFLVAYLNAWGAIIGLLKILFRNAFYTTKIINPED